MGHCNSILQYYDGRFGNCIGTAGLHNGTVEHCDGKEDIVIEQWSIMMGNRTTGTVQHCVGTVRHCDEIIGIVMS